MTDTSDRIRAMHRAVQFVDTHLKSPITVADMADHAGYSRFHFCRLFNRIVHHPPYDYLMRRRLSESTRELAAGRHKIIDIAYDYEFQNPETYARAFKRMLGVNPSHWRTNGADTTGAMPPLTLAHIRHRHQNSGLTPLKLELAPLRLIGLMQSTPPNGKERSVLWKEVLLALAGIGLKTHPLLCFGLALSLRQPGPEPQYYFAGVEKTTDLDITASPLVEKEVPTLLCARFVHRGSFDTLRLTRDYIYYTWLPKSGRSACLPLEIERFEVNPGLGDGMPESHEVLVPLKR